MKEFIPTPSLITAICLHKHTSRETSAFVYKSTSYRDATIVAWHRIKVSPNT